MTHTKRLLVLLCLILSAVLLTGCGAQPTANDRFQDYTKAWQKKDFTAMYQFLSHASKKSISKKQFVARYAAIYSGVGAGKLHMTMKKGKNNASSVSFKAVLPTDGGPVHFSETVHMVQEKQGNEKKWMIKWTPALILPGLQKGETIAVETLPGKRGDIFDRKGKPLAMNGTGARIDLVPGKLGTGAAKDANLKKITKLLGVSETQINQALKQSWVQVDSLVPIKTLASSDTDLIKKVTSLPGVYRTMIATRVYPDGKASGHLTGYVGQVTADTLKAHPNAGYTDNSIIGKTGLEQVYENKLRARDGAVIRIMKKDGTVKKIVAQKAPQNGQNLHLTIDKDAQDALYAEMTADQGAAVALDPKTGDVLALVSTPSYDPNTFVLGLSATDYQKLSQDKSNPLMNRFTQASAPGSVFKVFTAAAGLEHKTINPNDTITINGKSWQQNKSWGNYHVTRVDSAPKVNLQSALYLSDNIYFAQAALKIGADTFASEARRFGIGETLPFPYPMQTSTISNDGKLSSDLLLANSGYGQGQVSMTPLAMSLIYTSLVNQGSMIRPRLILSDAAPAFWKKDVMSPSTAQLLNDDLTQVIANPAGTAHDAAISGIPLAGKTGTPEFKKKQGQTGRENGWFIAYNTKDPKLLVTMMIENTQKHGGSHYLIPKVKTVFEKLMK